MPYTTYKVKPSIYIFALVWGLKMSMMILSVESYVKLGRIEDSRESFVFNCMMLVESNNHFSIIYRIVAMSGKLASSSNCHKADEMLNQRVPGF